MKDNWKYLLYNRIWICCILLLGASILPNQEVQAQCDPDTIPPEITCAGGMYVHTYTGFTRNIWAEYVLGWESSGAELSDNCDDDLLLEISENGTNYFPFIPLGCNDLGVYNFYIRATDDAGNSSTCTRQFSWGEMLNFFMFCKPEIQVEVGEQIFPEDLLDGTIDDDCWEVDLGVGLG